MSARMTMRLMAVQGGDDFGRAVHRKAVAWFDGERNPVFVLLGRHNTLWGAASSPPESVLARIDTGRGGPFVVYRGTVPGCQRIGRNIAIHFRSDDGRSGTIMARTKLAKQVAIWPSPAPSAANNPPLGV